MQSDEEIQAKCSECEKQEKEEPNNSSIQTKLTVGAPGDKYEQEADSMAAKVMTMPDSGHTAANSTPGPRGKRATPNAIRGGNSG
jgi:hypothetical protein